MSVVLYYSSYRIAALSQCARAGCREPVALELPVSDSGADQDGLPKMAAGLLKQAGTLMGIESGHKIDVKHTVVCSDCLQELGEKDG